MLAWGRSGCAGRAGDGALVGLATGLAAGFGDGSWANIPTRGGYVAFAGKEALPEVKPVYSLDDLTDVNATTPANGDIIQWDGSEWVNTQLPDAGAQDLDDLADVDTTGASANDILTYNGSTWEAAEAPDTDLANASINDLSDVRTTDGGGPRSGGLRNRDPTPDLLRGALPGGTD